MTGDHYLIEGPDPCNKFTAAPALSLKLLRNAHGVGAGGQDHMEILL